jgi:hypothetical protein
MMAEGGTHLAAAQADFMTYGVSKHYFIFKRCGKKMVKPYNAGRLQRWNKERCQDAF